MEGTSFCQSPSASITRDVLLENGTPIITIVSSYAPLISPQSFPSPISNFKPSSSVSRRVPLTFKLAPTCPSPTASMVPGSRASYISEKVSSIHSKNPLLYGNNSHLQATGPFSYETCHSRLLRVKETAALYDTNIDIASSDLTSKGTSEGLYAL